MAVKWIWSLNNKALCIRSSSCFFSFNFEHFGTLVILFIVSSVRMNKLLLFFFKFFLQLLLCWSLIWRPMSILISFLNLYSLFLSKFVFLLLTRLSLRVNTPNSLALHDRSNKSILNWSSIPDSSHWRASWESLHLSSLGDLIKLVWFLIRVNFKLVPSN